MKTFPQFTSELNWCWDSKLSCLVWASFVIFFSAHSCFFPIHIALALLLRLPFTTSSAFFLLLFGLVAFQLPKSYDFRFFTFISQRCVKVSKIANVTRALPIDRTGSMPAEAEFDASVNVDTVWLPLWPWQWTNGENILFLRRYGKLKMYFFDKLTQEESVRSSWN